MLYVAVRQGRVLCFDLRDPGDARRWGSLAAGDSFHRDVRSVSLSSDGARVDLPLPAGFRSPRYSAEVVRSRDGELVAEQVSVEDRGEEVRLTLYARTRRFRVDVSRRAS